MMYVPVLVSVPTAVQQFPSYTQAEDHENVVSATCEELEAQAADLEREAAELKRRAKQAMLEAAAITTAPPKCNASEPVVWVMQQAVPCHSSTYQDPVASPQALPYHAVSQQVCQAVPLQAVPVLCQVASQQSVPQHGPMVAEITSRDDTRTTLMLRNLPNDYTRDMTIEILVTKGFTGQFDFFYTPIDFNSNAGLGYAFVNAVSHEVALAMWTSLQHFDEWAIPSNKVLDISWSELSQGLEAHIARYRNSPVMHPDVPQEFKPVLFHQGVLREFPAPTKQIHAPRLKALRQGQRKNTEFLNTALHTQVVEKAPAMTPWDRVKKTIALINSGDIGRLCAHARKTLSSTVVLCVPKLGEFRSISQVCNFHQQLHEAIPDMKLSLEDIEAKMGTEKQIQWRVTCNGTQVKPLLPWLSLGAQTFTLQVTVVPAGKPKWIEWSFGLTNSQKDGTSDSLKADTKHIGMEVDEKRLKHFRGECQPCAYFTFRSDGCRRGDDCEFCHLCTKTQARAKKKAKALKIAREAKASEDASATETEEGDSS